MKLFSNRFGKKKREASAADLSILKTDVHSHLIPGIDDGSKDMHDSLMLISGLQKLGFKKVITTPHIMGDLYPNTSEIILSGLEKVRAALVENHIDMEIEAAAEYLVDYDFEEKLKREKLLTFGKNYVLIELSFIESPSNLSAVIFEMQLQGYTPVLAHPERYPYFVDAIEKLVGLKEKGVILQLNINSLSGSYGPQVKRFAEKLLMQNLIKMVGSDCHHAGHLNLMRQAKSNSHLKAAIDSGRLLNDQL